MVRYARADGSKGSNKRKLEEPTPWMEMVTQVESSKIKVKKGHETQDNEGEKDEKTITAAQSSKKKKKLNMPTKKEYTINADGKRVKVFRNGEEKTWFDLPYEESDTMTRYDGMWVKKEMVSELDRLRATLKEEGLDNKEMMRKMMKAKRKAHRQLRIELLYQQKSLLSEAMGETEKTDLAPLKTKKKKKKNKSDMSPENNPNNNSETVETQNTAKELSKSKTDRLNIMGLEVKNKVITFSDEDEDGKKEIKNKKEEEDDEEKETENVSEVLDEENKNKVDENEKEVHSFSKNFSITQQNVEKGEEMIQYEGQEKISSCSQTDDGHSSLLTCEESKPMRHERNERFKGLTRDERETQSHTIHNLSQSRPNSTYEFEENDLMTKYEGYWVMHSSVPTLEEAKKSEVEAIYAGRGDGSLGSEKELTPDEKFVLKRAMKKWKRVHHRLLLGRLGFQGQRVSGGESYKQNEFKKKTEEKKTDGEKLVKFDGFWVKAEAADRLHKLRRKLKSEGLSQEEVDKVIQRERRKEERILRNERKSVCLNCRQPGHIVSACPGIVGAEGESTPTICYTCGSTEHTASSCNLKKSSEKNFAFATCYICKESGHISRQCPDNPRGLYPKGGACRGCGSVEHFAKDCPDLQKEKEVTSIKVGRLKGEELEALEVETEEQETEQEPSPSKKRRKTKVVTF